ncbi:hypothetical protein B0H11DRAFT_2226321 [Mycena galericulata]|nr:hypothetical protein B0H11DRAFT_2226321 [Mycena galericulata]
MTPWHSGATVELPQDVLDSIKTATSESATSPAKIKILCTQILRVVESIKNVKHCRSDFQNIAHQICGLGYVATRRTASTPENLSLTCWVTSFTDLLDEVQALADKCSTVKFRSIPAIRSDQAKLENYDERLKCSFTELMMAIVDQADVDLHARSEPLSSPPVPIWHVTGNVSNTTFHGNQTNPTFTFSTPLVYGPHNFHPSMGSFPPVNTYVQGTFAALEIEPNDELGGNGGYSAVPS